MAPYKTNAENIIWSIIENGPTNIANMEKIINWKGKRNSLSALVAMIWMYLGDDGIKIITRKKGEDHAFLYEKAKNIGITVEEATKLYREAARKKYKETHSKKGNKNPSKQTKIKAPKKKNIQNQPEVEQGQTMLLDKLSHILGVDVNVSVDVVFRFGK